MVRNLLKRTIKKNNFWLHLPEKTKSSSKSTFGKRCLLGAKLAITAKPINTEQVPLLPSSNMLRYWDSDLSFMKNVSSM